MNNNNNIEEIFRKKLENFESNPPANAWTNIHSQINANAGASASSTGVAKGLSAAAKLFIAASVATITVASGYFLLSDDSSNEITKTQPVISETQIDNTPQPEEKPIITEEINSPKTAIDKSENKEEASPTEFSTETGIIEKTSTNVNASEIISEEKQMNELETQTQENQNSSENNQSSQPEKIIAQTEEKESEIEKTALTEQNENPETALNNSEDSLIRTTRQPEISKESVEKELIISPIPNVITPNHDGVNDIIKINVENYLEFKAQVFDLSGNLIFEWDTPTGFWDGNDVYGNAVPKGNYAIVVTVKDLSNKLKTQKSIITLYK
ncbi:MAG TPA: hypothetical protein DIU39_03745 [Flavobacteriales bacterium]|nr:hypothetical protein [Flavobacteriales bacterium]|tara:strand:- start:130834 stop:131814 length:981 start_codon:yes stop_codon:yes gene_type:complete